MADTYASKELVDKISKEIFEKYKVAFETLANTPVDHSPVKSNEQKKTDNNTEQPK